jgi:hypothetical protein
MTDQPFYAPNHTTAPRQPRAGEDLWTVQKNGRQLACELRDDGAAGVEVQVSRDGELLYSRDHGRPARRCCTDWRSISSDDRARVLS